MQINSMQGAYNSLDFTIKTRSGDTLSLNMYDNKSMEYSATKEGKAQSQQLTLTHAYGYNFSYEGNGIDAQDQKEIAQALEALQPRIKEYLASVEESGIPSPRDILNTAFEFRQELPTPKNENHKNAIAQGLLETFDKTLGSIGAQQKALETAQTLFEKMLEQLESFSLYA
jgi:spore cortex formation protein SpoVR/YcgB (stage V sporulation)